jgi:hypothetical protein
MKIFEPLLLKFESPKWVNDPELGLIDTVLEEHPELITMLASDITAGAIGLSSAFNWIQN